MTLVNHWLVFRTVHGLSHVELVGYSLGRDQNPTILLTVKHYVKSWKFLGVNQSGKQVLEYVS